LIYTDPDGEFPWLAAGIFAIFSYFKTAHYNRDLETGKWAWNPVDWFKEGNNTTVVVGVSTNSSFSSFTGYAGIGSDFTVPAVSYNTEHGLGVGNANNPGFNEFFYPSINYNAPVENAIASLENGRNKLIESMNSSYSGPYIPTVENYNSVEYTGFYYDNAEEMRNQLHHMSDMQGGVELILAEDYTGGAYLLPSKVYNGKGWLNNGPDNGYVSSYHLNILNIDKANIKMFGHDHDRSYRFTNPDDYNLFYNWRKSIYIIMPDGRILYKHYPTGVEYNYLPGY